VNDTWSHAAARTLVRPLVGTWVRPNHITLLRLVTGVLACLLLARGGGRAELWSGILWLFSAFLDRADGELARVGKMQSRGGHLFDYYTDVALNSAFFLAAGVNLYNAGAGTWSIAAGIVACAAMLACCLLAEAYESDVATGERVWRMPLGPEYDKMIDSKFADMKNTGGRWGGAITAAQLLQRFVSKTPWAHLDIAGTGIDSPQNDINKSWASGWGVRLLERLVEDYYER